MAELAFAPKGLDLAAREVKDGTFLYGKTVTLPFFPSGVVDLPPGGEKRMRNARKHHMVFWVFAGRVDVELNEFAFSIGRGGMWQVPRGESLCMAPARASSAPFPGVPGMLTADRVLCCRKLVRPAQPLRSTHAPLLRTGMLHVGGGAGRRGGPVGARSGHGGGSGAGLVLRLMLPRTTVTQPIWHTGL